MRRGGAATIASLALLVAVPQAGASSTPVGPVRSMSVTVSSRVARAHPIRLALTLRYEMQCGYPGGGPLVITFPAALKLPRAIPAGAVTLNAKAIPTTVDGRQVTVTVPPPMGVLCQTMGPGSVTLAFTRGARLANPPRAGSYSFTATHGKLAFAAKLAIKAAG